MALKPVTMDKEAFIEKKEAQKQVESNKEQLDKEIILQLSFVEKMELIKQISTEIISDSERKYRKIIDLIAFTEDPKDVDIVLKAV